MTPFEAVESAITQARRTLVEYHIYARITIELTPKDWDNFRATLPPMSFQAQVPTSDDTCIVSGHVVRLKREP